MIVNTPAFDYLTLTSKYKWDFEAFQRTTLACADGRLKQGRLMQFKGIKDSALFCGAATIQGEDVFIFKASGERAQTAALEIADEMPGVCKRVDIQITVPLPEDYSARVLADGLSWSDWIGHKRPVEMREGEQGFDTVYIGRRTAGDFTRIYVKTDGIGMWLRFETQFQKGKAAKVWPVVARDRVQMGKVLRGRVDQIPEITDEPGMRAIRERLDYAARNVPGTRRVPNENSTFTWLRDTVTPVIERMLNDHDYGDRVKELVRGWAEEL